MASMKHNPNISGEPVQNVTLMLECAQIVSVDRRGAAGRQENPPTKLPGYTGAGGLQTDKEASGAGLHAAARFA